MTPKTSIYNQSLIQMCTLSFPMRIASWFLINDYPHLGFIRNSTLNFFHLEKYLVLVFDFELSE